MMTKTDILANRKLTAQSVTKRHRIIAINGFLFQKSNKRHDDMIDTTCINLISPSKHIAFLIKSSPRIIHAEFLTGIIRFKALV